MKWNSICLSLFVVLAWMIPSVGCKQPVKTYKFSTSSPDVWASEPKQKVEFTVEWRQ